MALQLDSEEPEGGPWRARPLTVVVEAMLRHGGGRAAGRQRQGVVLAVDGRSSGGKTTLAARLQDAIVGSAVVHTDDIAWWHSRFGWADLLIDGILVPFHRGELVSFRPPGWARHGRQGSIQVPAMCPVLIIEGVGAGRSEVSHLIDALVWVHDTGLWHLCRTPGRTLTCRYGFRRTGRTLSIDLRVRCLTGCSALSSLMSANTPFEIPREVPAVPLLQVRALPVVSVDASAAQ